jgi:Tfp pilus assembly protein PilO
MSNIASTILLLASIGIFFGFVSPSWSAATGASELSAKSVAELRAERALYNDALTKAREIEEARAGLLQAYNAIPAKDLERLETLLPDHIDSVRFIIDINALAAGYGLTLKNVNLEDIQKDGAKTGAARAIGPKSKLYQSVGIKFSVAGDYDDFRAFLNDLEANLRLADARRVEFTVKDDGPYDFSVTLDTYRLD